MTAAELEKLLEQVTPGEWHAGRDYEDGPFVAGAGYCRANMVGPSNDRWANARLIALAPTLARRAIAAEKLVNLAKIVCNMDDGTERFDGAMDDLEEALAAYEATQ